MKPETSPDSLAIPPDLLAEVKAAAEQEHRAPSELLREAVERYMEARAWNKIFAYGGERAKALGLTEEDVPRLIAESRQEQRQGCE